MNVVIVKLCMMVAFIELYLFITLGDLCCDLTLLALSPDKSGSLPLRLTG